MAVYLIVMREGPVRDQDSYNRYVQMNQENPPAMTLKPLAAYGAIHRLEGEAPDGVVMLEFASVDAAHGWYDSPSYQSSLPFRINSGDWRAFIVEGAMNLP